MTKSEVTDIAGIVKHTTAKAILLDTGIKEVWLPLSQIEIFEDGGKGVIVTMPNWLAKKLELDI